MLFYFIDSSNNRFVKYRKDYEENIKNLNINKIRDYPNTVILELVNRCDLECVICFQRFRNDAEMYTQIYDCSCFFEKNKN